MNSFPLLFYTGGALAAISCFAVTLINRRGPEYAAVFILLFPLILIYLVGMYRVDGVDFDGYRAFFNNEQDDLIPDVGYEIIVRGAQSTGMNISQFFFLQGVFTLAVVIALAKKFRCEIIITVAIYLLHSAIVRDFSQSRIALSVAIYFLALIQDNRVKHWLLGAIAVSVHLSILPLIAIYQWIDFASNRSSSKVVLIYGPVFLIMAGSSILLPVFAMVDPRIEIYMNWKEASYGEPVESYSALILYFLIIAMCYRVLRLVDDKLTLTLLLLALYAVAIFIGFRDLSIMASRLSNVVGALYPFAVGRVLYLIKSNRTEGVYSFERMIFVGLLVLIIGALIGRSGSFDVVNAVLPAAFR